MNKPHLSLSILGILLLLPAFRMQTFAQIRSSILQEIGQNNLQLQALKKHANAEKASARSGLFNHQPEVEFGYFFGKPAETGNRIDFSVSQSFDFPTAYYFRHKLQKGQMLSSDLEYEIHKRRLLDEIGCLCIEIIACNRMKKELEKRLRHAEQMNAAYREMFEKGECGILEANKTGLNLLNARKAFEENEITRNQLQTELQGMNAGKDIVLEDTSYQIVQLPDDFKTWYASISTGNPVLKNIETRQAMQKQQVQLQKALCLPGISVGFQSEKEVESAYRGVGVGLSIPLWGNVRRLKAAQAEAEAQTALGKHEQLLFYQQLQLLYEKAQLLQRLSEKYRLAIQQVDNGDLLQLTFEKGEISLVEYLTELSVYYDALNQSIESDKDFMLSAYRLLLWE